MNETTSAPLANAIEATPEDLRMPPPHWRRVIPRWLRGLLWVDEARQYDAFLSYSWKADSDIAPLLQSVIQRFLCSWYRVRARTLFRDLSSMAAGALLDDELRARLDRSDRLIVLASPAAAASRGMEFESAHWIRTGRPVILVLTGGTATEWNEIRATLLPAALASSLTKEPVIVDIRQQIVRFRSGEFDRSVRGELIEAMQQLLLAFYPNGTTWESLRGEERRQRRNALTWLSCGVLALLSTTVVAVVGAYIAHQQTIVAQRETQAAKEASQAAEDSRKAAVESKDRAEAQRRLAVGRSLAVTAATVAKDRNDATPHLLAALVVEALKRIPEPEGRALAATVGLRLSQAVPFSHRSDEIANVMFLDGQDTLAMVEFATGLDLVDFQSGQSNYVPASQFGAHEHSAPSNRFSILSRTSPYVIVEASDSYSYVVDTASLKVHALPADSWSIQFSPDRQSFATLSRNPDTLNIFHLPSFKRTAIPLEEYSATLLAHTSGFTALPAATGLRIVWSTGESGTFVLPGSLEVSSAVSDGTVLYVAASLPRHSSVVPPPESPPSVADESASAPPASGPEPKLQPSRIGRPTIRPGIFKLNPKSGHFERIFDGGGFLERFGETQLIVAGDTRAALLDLTNTRPPFIVQLNGLLTEGSVYEPYFVSSRRWIAFKVSTGWHFIDVQTGTQWFVSQQDPKTAKLAYDTNTAVLIGEADTILVELESQTVLARLEEGFDPERVAISDSGRLLAIGSPHGASVARLDPSQLLSYLCSGKGVNMRPEDWNRYVGDEPWQPTCTTWTNPSDTSSTRK